MKFGEKLQKLRKQAGLSQEELAAKLSVSRQAVSKWELGESLPDTDKVLLISKSFHVSADYLLDEDAPEPDLAGASSCSAPGPEEAQHAAKSDGPRFFRSLVRRWGHWAGYVISGYAALVLLMMRFAHFAFSKMMPPLDAFGLTEADLPVSFRIPFYFTNIISVLAIAAIAGGIVLAIYLKKKLKELP